MGAQRKRRSDGNASTATRYRIRPAHQADLSTLAEIERLVFTDPWPMSGFQALLGDYALVAEADGDIVGYVFARVAAEEAEILNLAVRPERRRRGMGRDLLEAAMKAASVAGAGRVYLEVRVSNQAARGFYTQMGFQPVGLRKEYYEQPPEDALILARPLEPL